MAKKSSARRSSRSEPTPLDAVQVITTRLSTVTLEDVQWFMDIIAADEQRSIKTSEAIRRLVVYGVSKAAEQYKDRGPPPSQRKRKA